MITKARAATLVGINAVLVEIEVDMMGGKPEFIMVGLPDKAVEESRDRVRTAIRNSNLDLPAYRIVCNLAPGDIKKEGPALDLPIAAALLASTGQIRADELEDCVLLGELGLDGALRRIDGALSVAILCKELGVKRLILPKDNAPEAAAVGGLDVFGLESLSDLLTLFNEGGLFPIESEAVPTSDELLYTVDFAEIKGQKHAIRALEIVAAGGHNLLMVGPPGSGKTMLARRLVTILPPLGRDESVEVTRIYSSAGKKGDVKGLMWERPFRAPHHTTSYAAMVGGGKSPKPGEVSLAHHGVLFLDECAEFGRDVLESLRQPLEDGIIQVSRVQATMIFPAECMVVCAMNPCPCGLKGYPDAQCVGNPTTCGRYGARLSGPLLDRIDLHINVPRLKPEELMGASNGEPSARILERVMRAREKQSSRFGQSKVNAKMTPKEVQEIVVLTSEARDLMARFAAKMNLSGRVYDRLLKVARTLADLDSADQVDRQHLSEAIQYRERHEV